jgi:amino acid adenylation domain-containing protein
MQGNTPEGYPLSPQQRHLWKLLSGGGEARAHQARCAVLIKGVLDAAVLRESLHLVVRRHEVLRTFFYVPPHLGYPLQVIGDVSIAWEETQSASGFDDATYQNHLEDFFKEDEASDPEAEHEPKLRASLARLADNKHVLFLSLHTLCCDAAGLRNLVGELGHCYTTQAHEDGAELPEEPVQYADLAQWLNELQEAEDTVVGRDFWRKRDASPLQAMSLPFEQPADAQTLFDVRSLSHVLETETFSLIESFTRQHDATPFAFLLACWQVMLARLMRQEKTIVGVSFDGRNYEGLEEAIGLFARFLPLHSHVTRQTTFAEAFRQAHDAMREAREWQEYFSHEQFSEGVATAAGARRQDYFPFCFEYEPPHPPHQMRGLTFSLAQRQVCFDRFKLNLSCIEREGHLFVEFLYDARAFRTADVERVARQFFTLLESAAKEPEKRCEELSMLGPEELRQVLVEFNDTQLEYPSLDCIHKLFERWAAQTPDAAAFICDGQQMSYAELNARANRLARHLRASGVERSTLVGIFMERSPLVAVAVLAILKAGGAYVPLDPSYPRERLAFMLRDANVSLLLTEDCLATALPQHDMRVVACDNEWPTIAQHEAENLHSTTSPHDLAYVIYTSGSIGEPKGVMIAHANLSHYVQAMNSRLRVSPADRYLHTASISFSSSVRQLLVPFAHGASVVMASTAQRLDPLALFELIKREVVTIIDLVPSYWRTCIQVLRRLTSETRESLLENSLRLILSASEPLAHDIPRTWTTEFKHRAAFINMFGQTETTGIVALFPIINVGGGAKRGVPIGQAIPNTRIYLLDRQAQPVPIGMSGELCIGGDGLGYGYLNHPELTAEKFAPDPFSQRPGARLYHTGDMARFESDGTIEFLGRRDFQVKLRGFRVELGEIESALGSHEAVHEAAVVACDKTDGDKHLVAFVVPRQTPAPSESGLQSYLREKLPTYMSPAKIIVLNTFPLTPNGKLDRQALAEFAQTSETREQVYVAPRTPIEESLAEIWAQVLNVPRIGIHDNFFKLGGHSLLSTVLISRIREAFHVELPVLALFEVPTVAELAGTIEQSLIKEVDSEEMLEMLKQMDGLSDEEIKALLADEGGHVV